MREAYRKGVMTPLFSETSHRKSLLGAMFCDMFSSNVWIR